MIRIRQNEFHLSCLDRKEKILPSDIDPRIKNLPGQDPFFDRIVALPIKAVWLG